MTKKLGKKISAAIFFVSLFVGNFFVPSEEVQAAGSDCCVYTVSSATKPPQWLSDLGDGAMWFESGTVGKPCKKPSEITTLAQKKIDQFYEYNSGKAIPGSCGNTGEYKTFSDAVLNTGCCEITNNTGVLRSCTPIDKAEALKSETFSSCLVASYKQFLDVPNGDKLIAHKKDCTAVTSCQELQKKIETVKADNKTAADNAAAQQKAAADLAAMIAGGKTRLPWTKAECIAVLQKGSTEQQYDWIPPKSDLNAQIGDYCYIKQLPTKMQVDIGSTGVISGLPQYINIAYKYALGIGVIVMIVVIVFSGIQWMLSGAISSINNSKDRIKNAALGLLLLFGANTILYTINPQLLNMKLPPMHAIRPEKFDVAQTAEGDKGVPCDPGEANACADKGADFKCKPTAEYAVKMCSSQLKVFFAAGVVGGIAGGAAAIAATVGSGVSASGAVGNTLGNYVRTNAPDVISDVISGVANNESAESTAMEVGTDLIPGGGKSKKIMMAVVAGVGLAGAAYAYSSSQEAVEPPNGYCVQIKPEKSDGSVCSFDGECKSSKCLITSTGACGAGKFGVCTSGELRQACVIKKTYAFGLIDGNKEDAAKFACKAGEVACVDNGRGASSKGVGICSDGSGVGMLCNSEVACKGLITPLECIKGLCREKGYFSPSGKTVMLKPGAACISGSDCSDVNGLEQSLFQDTQVVGCMKPPSSALNLPARFLVSQANGKVDLRYFRELDSQGVCQTDRSYYIERADLTNYSSQIKNVLPQTCFVNIYPRQSLTSSEQKVSDYLKSNGVDLGYSFNSGFVMEYVGCQKETACRIRASDFSNNAVMSSSFVSVKGSCSFMSLTGNQNVSNSFSSVFSNKTHPDNGGIGIVKDPIWGVETIYVASPDKSMNKISTPNLVDLSNTFAGESGN